jgi:hypothetical protein
MCVAGGILIATKSKQQVLNHFLPLDEEENSTYTCLLVVVVVKLEGQINYENRITTMTGNRLESLNARKLSLIAKLVLIRREQSAQGGVGIKNMDLGSIFLLTDFGLNQPAT